MVVRRRLHLGGAVSEGGSGDSPRRALSAALSLAISASAASSSFCSFVCLSASGAHVLGASAGASAAGASAAGASAAGSEGFVAQALSKAVASSTPSKLSLASASPKPWLERSTTFFPSRSSERSWNDLTPSASLYCLRKVVRVSPFCVRDDEDHE